MDRKQQLQLVDSLGNDLIQKVSDLIQAGEIPAEWQGKELRQYMADRLQRGNSLTGTRKAHYSNAIAISGQL